MNQHVDDARIKEYNEAYSQIDKDGSNSIVRSELFTIFRILGMYPDDKELQAMYEQVDPQETGEILREKFLNWMERYDLESKRKNRLEETFKVMDKTKEGSIIVGEIVEIMKSLGEEISEQDAKQMIHVLDQNGDNRVSLEEFLALLNK
jgi:calmodulin